VRKLQCEPEPLHQRLVLVSPSFCFPFFSETHKRLDFSPHSSRKAPLSALAQITLLSSQEDKDVHTAQEPYAAPATSSRSPGRQFRPLRADAPAAAAPRRQHSSRISPLPAPPSPAPRLLAAAEPARPPLALRASAAPPDQRRQRAPRAESSSGSGVRAPGAAGLLLTHGVPCDRHAGGRAHQRADRQLQGLALCAVPADAEDGRGEWRCSGDEGALPQHALMRRSSSLGERRKTASQCRCTHAAQPSSNHLPRSTASSAAAITRTPQTRAWRGACLLAWEGGFYCGGELPVGGSRGSGPHGRMRSTACMQTASASLHAVRMKQGARNPRPPHAITRPTRFGIRYIIENYVSKRWTMEDVDRADAFYKCVPPRCWLLVGWVVGAWVGVAVGGWWLSAQSTRLFQASSCWVLPH